MSETDRPQKITFAEMRDMGVRGQNLKEGAKKGKREKDPYKQTKIPEVGD